MFGIKSFRAANDIARVKDDVQWWFTASIESVVNRASQSKDKARESSVRRKAAETYYQSIREFKLNELAAIESGCLALTDCQVAEMKLKKTKKILKQKLLQAGSKSRAR